MLQLMLVTTNFVYDYYNVDTDVDDIFIRRVFILRCLRLKCHINYEVFEQVFGAWGKLLVILEIYYEDLKTEQFEITKLKQV